MLDSIPDDYTTLTETVDRLKEDVSKLSEDVEQLKSGGTTPVTKTASVNITQGQSVTIKATAKNQNVIPIWTDEEQSNGGSGVVSFKQMMVSNETFPVEFAGGSYGLIGEKVFGNPCYEALSLKGDDVGGSSHMIVALYFEDVPDNTTLTTILMLCDKDGNNIESGGIITNGWYYGVIDCSGFSKPTNTKPTFKPSNTIKVKYAYGLSYGIVSNEIESDGYNSNTKQKWLSQSKYKELPLTPNPSSVGMGIVSYGESDGETSEIIKASAKVNDVIYTSDDASIPISANAIIECISGSVSFEYEYKEYTDSSDTVGEAASRYPDWSEWTWVVIGDSLTDETINATKKYYRYIEEKTGIKVIVSGVGGTGYARDNSKSHADATQMYYQRCVGIADLVSDAGGDLSKVVVSVFGSINDWCVTNPNDGRFIGGSTYTTREQAIGKSTDVWNEEGDNTLTAHMRHCYDIIWSELPLAHLFTVNHLYYDGIANQEEHIVKPWESVNVAMRIKHFDLYHNGSFPIDINQEFANKYTTDAPEDVASASGSYGHPSNLFHEEMLAPYFYKCLQEVMPLM